MSGQHELVGVGLIGLGIVLVNGSGCSKDDGGGAAGAAPTTTSSTSSSTTTSSTDSGGSGGTEPQGGAGGVGGSEPCTPVGVGAYVDVMTEEGGSNLLYDITGLDPASEDVLFVEFYDVAGFQTVGDFDLSQPPDNQYQTCAHCLVAYENFNDASPPAFFQASGTLHVTVPDITYSGATAGSFENVKLVEVTIDSSVSTPVPGGRCLLLNGSWDHAGGG
jgi:hypothetical protein